MTADDLASIPFGPSTTGLPLARAPKHAHDWTIFAIAWTIGEGSDGPYPTNPVEQCRDCGLTRADYELRRKKGKSSLRAGKEAERAIARAYAGKRVGQYGGITDVIVGELFSVQSKAGGWFSERMWAELAKLPRTGGRVPTLIVSDRPGPGKKTRRLVIRTLEDDLDLHGPLPGEELIGRIK